AARQWSGQSGSGVAEIGSQTHHAADCRRAAYRAIRPHVFRTLVFLTLVFWLRRAIEFPDDDEMREALDVGEPQLKLGQDLEHTIGLVFSAKTLGNFACVLVRTTHKSNRPRGEHGGNVPPFPILMPLQTTSHTSKVIQDGF